jgi:hypothetical protein
VFSNVFNFLFGYHHTSGHRHHRGYSWHPPKGPRFQVAEYQTNSFDHHPFFLGKAKQDSRHYHHPTQCHFTRHWQASEYDSPQFNFNSIQIQIKFNFRLTSNSVWVGDMHDLHILVNPHGPSSVIQLNMHIAPLRSSSNFFLIA